MSTPAETIVIGHIAGVFGVRGEAKVNVYSDTAERFLNITACWAHSPNGTLEPLQIDSVRIHKGRALVKFQGFDTPEQLQPLLHRDLHIAKADRQPLGEGEYYLADLLGLAVRLPDGTQLGTVRNVIETGANDIYEVVDATGRVALIPAIGSVVRQIDLAAGVIDITPLPGLLD